MCKYNTINNIMGNDKKNLNKKIHTKQQNVFKIFRHYSVSWLGILSPLIRCCPPTVTSGLSTLILTKREYGP